MWEVRIGRFVYAHEDSSGTGDRALPGRIDSATGVSSGAPSALGDPTLIRTTTKATINHYLPGFWGADHRWKMGGQVERGEHHSAAFIPAGRRSVDVNRDPSEVISSPRSNIGGVFITSGVFASDAITVRDRITISAGVRFDHSRAISQDLHAMDAQGHPTDETVRSLGTLYTWNLWSPRLGVTMKLRFSLGR